MESRREKAGGYERLRSWVALGELFRGVWSNDRIGMDVQGGQRRNSVQPEWIKKAYVELQDFVGDLQRVFRPLGHFSTDDVDHVGRRDKDGLVAISSSDHLGCDVDVELGRRL